MARSILFFISVIFFWLIVLATLGFIFFKIFHFEFNSINKDLVEIFSGFLSIFLVAIFFCGCNKLKLKNFFAFKKVGTLVLFYYSAPAIIYISLMIIFGGVDSETQQNINEKALLEIMIAIILTPVFEELIFRGGMFSFIGVNKLQILGVWLISSLCFMLIHPHYTSSEFYGMLIISFYLGYTRIKTNSTIVPIFIHMLINANILFFVIS